MDQRGRHAIGHEVPMGQTEREPRASQQRRSPQVRDGEGGREEGGGERERGIEEEQEGRETDGSVRVSRPIRRESCCL